MALSGGDLFIVGAHPRDAGTYIVVVSNSATHVRVTVEYHVSVSGK